jgi:hypothetical protein
MCACAAPVAAYDGPRAGSAGADSVKVGCAQAYESAQRLREARRLRDAREQLLVCARPECPTLLRRDCAPWLGEVDAAIPSVVIVAHGADGRTQVDGRVLADGAVVASRVDATPIALDPGEHLLVVEMAGGARAEERVTLREGEREHRVDVTLPVAETSPPAAEPRTPRTSHADEPSPSPAERPVPPLVYVLGAAGIAVATIGAYFQIAGMSKRSDLFTCEPACSSSQVDDARRSLWIGNVALTVGVVSLAGALVLYFLRPTATSGAAR